MSVMQKMQKALAYAVVRIDQGLDDIDTEHIRAECAAALAESLGVSVAELGTPDLQLFETFGDSPIDPRD